MLDWYRKDELQVVSVGEWVFRVESASSPLTGGCVQVVSTTYTLVSANRVSEVPLGDDCMADNLLVIAIV